MDGKYLASNIAPLKAIGDGKVFITINDLVNSKVFEEVEIVAYSIVGFESEIPCVDCLFQHTERGTLYFRTIEFYKGTKNVEDCLNRTAKYGRGFADHDLTRFIELRDFYLQCIDVKA